MVDHVQDTGARRGREVEDGEAGADGSADPRVVRTRRRLKRALIELLDEIGYERITVERLATRADVGRSTFYLHFGSKEDLLFDGFEEWLLSFSERGPETPFRFRFSFPLLRHAAAQVRFFRTTVVRGRSWRVRRRLRKIIARVALAEMRQAGLVPQDRGAGADAPSDLAIGHAEVVAGAFEAVLEWWIEGGTGRTAAEVDRVLQASVLSPSAEE